MNIFNCTVPVRDEFARYAIRPLQGRISFTPHFVGMLPTLLHVSLSGTFRFTRSLRKSVE